jgi:FkbM family methyltransferase
VIVPVWMRRTRLRAVMARHLVNWRETSQAYLDAAPLPPLRFRNGMTLEHGARDAAAFLFFEVFAHRCYRAGLSKRSAGTVIDIGANIGAFTLDCAARHPAIEIHAYEPDPETCAVLRRNVAANRLEKRVTVWNEAVTAKAGPLTLWRGDNSAVASAFLSERKGEACTATGVTFDTVAGRAGNRIALLKIDAEGAEADILEGARLTLDAVERIVAEYHEWLVPDVKARIVGVLSPSFDVEFTSAGSCGPMFRARRRPNGSA